MKDQISREDATARMRAHCLELGFDAPGNAPAGIAGDFVAPGLVVHLSCQETAVTMDRIIRTAQLAQDSDTAMFYSRSGFRTEPLNFLIHAVLLWEYDDDGVVSPANDYARELARRRVEEAGRKAAAAPNNAANSLRRTRWKEWFGL